MWAICADDFSVGCETVLRWWFLSWQQLSFRQWFLSQLWTTCADDFSVGCETMLRWWFLSRQRLSFHQRFLSQLWTIRADDFWVGSDSDFMNNSWVGSSLCALTIFAEYGVTSESVSLTSLWHQQNSFANNFVF